MEEKLKQDRWRRFCEYKALPARLKILIFLVLVFLNSQPLSALDIWGSFEHQLTGRVEEDRYSFMNHNRLRIDLSSEIAENIVFRGNFIAQTFHGRTKFNLLDFIPEKFHLEAGNLPPEVLKFEMEDEYTLDNAFVSFRSPLFAATLGRQQLPWGTGYVWNPTSVFQVRSILEPAREEFPGVDALRVDLPFGRGGSLSFISAPDENWHSFDTAMRVKRHLRGFDLSASLINQETEERWLYGADFVGELLGLGVWGEFAYNRLPTSDYLQFVLGADYTFEFQTHIMMEYFHQGQGQANYRDYTLTDWLELLGGIETNLGRDYIFLRASHPVTDLMELGGSGLVNLNDGSFFLVPELRYSLAENVELIAMLNLFQGGPGTEYGQFPSGGFVRVRVYF